MIRMFKGVLLALLVMAAGALLVKKTVYRDSTRGDAFYLATSRLHDLFLSSPHGAEEWKKYRGNPVLGDSTNICFDVCVVADTAKLRLFYSWRNRRSIGLSSSTNPDSFTLGTIAVAGSGKDDWGRDVNRPGALPVHDSLYIWYTGQNRGRSSIGLVAGPSAGPWKKVADSAVMKADLPWEKTSVMCPSVLYDSSGGKFRMWYSGGEDFEPDAIGYAESPDGIHWKKRDRPVFLPDRTSFWERFKVTACQVFREDGYYYMLYVGFADVHHARIGLARSRDGIAGWERYGKNPIISEGKDPGSFDRDAAYKPFVVKWAGKWYLFYNGRRGHVETIGVAVNEGKLWRGP